MLLIYYHNSNLDEIYQRINVLWSAGLILNISSIEKYLSNPGKQN